jgi:2,3-bisphosphoglycerate-dependent phosphoglycerate mutase
LIVTAKLNGVDPQAWLADVLHRINDHRASRLHALLPWNWKAWTATLAEQDPIRSEGPPSGGFSIGDDSISLAAVSKLLLIRHCQSTGRHPDAPLSEAGAKAAGALITRLHDLAPDAVYSSPYERAHATVRPFAISAGLSVALDDRLRERVLSDRDLDDRLDHIRRSFAEPDYRAPGGESLNQTKQRAIAALTDIAAAGHRLPAVSSHRNLIASVLRSMDTAFGFEQWQDLRTPDLFEIELDAGRPIRFVRLDALRRFAGQ